MTIIELLNSNLHIFIIPYSYIMPRHYYYAVARGVQPGIYYARSVKEYNDYIRRVVDNFSGNKYERFTNLSDALTFMKDDNIKEVFIYDKDWAPLKKYTLFNESYELTQNYTVQSGSNDDAVGRTETPVATAVRDVNGTTRTPDRSENGVENEETSEEIEVNELNFLSPSDIGVEVTGGAIKQTGENVAEEADVRAEEERLEETIDEKSRIPRDVPVDLSATADTSNQFDLVSRLLERLDQLEERIKYLENELECKKKNSKNDSQAIVNGLKLVTDTSQMLINKMDTKDRELNKIRSDVAVLKATKVTQGGSKGEYEWQVAGRRRKNKGGKSKKGNQGKTNKFELLADSHGRDLSNLLTGAEVTVKGGAILERVVEGAGRKEGGTVIMGGTNDESVEELKKGLFKLREGLGNKRRVVIVGVPHRYDKTHRYTNQMLTKKELSAREQLIKSKNELLRGFCNYHNYVFLNIDDSKRSDFTNHGLHFNMAGKRWLARKIQTAVRFL